ncbi:MAG: 2-C-methyl-D-erythritol 4-phosphate cytidylyltransferase [Magnetococcales bacterium]|nr:2-C-methyl-D-erythritol 4-phosphate cytidylyltransferase [Magnetococcales bacterium]
MNKSELITFLVVAAGQGRRLGGEIPKQYRLLAGYPVLWHTLKRLHDHPLVENIVPIIAPDGRSLWDQVMGPLVAPLVKVSQPVTGGKERQNSVANGLSSLTLKKDQWVAIHDGARPVLRRGMLDRLFLAREKGDALLTAQLASDTIKKVGLDGVVRATLDRREIWLAQTPQLFRYELIRRAHRSAAEAGWMGTDDVSLVEWLGEPVRVVEGDGANIKITQASDLLLAEWLLTMDACEGQR